MFTKNRGNGEIMKNVSILAFSFDNGSNGAHPNQEEIIQLLEEHLQGGGGMKRI
jgi:hypothetical protein